MEQPQSNSTSRSHGDSYDDFDGSGATKSTEILPTVSPKTSPHDTMNNNSSKISILSRRMTVQLKKALNIESLDSERSKKRKRDEYLQTTTIHGIAQAYNSTHLNTKIFWMSMVALVSVVVTIQIWNMINYYVLLPTVTSIMMVHPTDGVPFPSVTLCSMSKINITAVLEKYPKMSRTIAEFATTTFVSVSSTALYDEGYFSGVLDVSNTTEEEKQRMKDIHDGLSQSYAKAREGLTIEEFLQDAMFSCRGQFQYCWLENSAVFDCCTGIPYGHTEPIVTTRRHLIHSGACYEFNFEPFRQKTPGPVGGFGFVYLYPNAHVLKSAFNSHGGYAVHLYTSTSDAMLERAPSKLPVGYHSQLHMQATKTKNVKLDLLGSNKCQDPTLTYFNNYTYDSCQVECMVDFNFHHCNCTGISTVGKIPTNFTCSPLAAMECHKKTFKRSQVDLAKCRLQKCPEQCEYWKYHPTLSVSKAFNPELEELQLQYWRLPLTMDGVSTANSLIIGEVYFDDIQYTEMEQKAALTLASFVSNIGGAMGLWTGASIISWIHLIYFCMASNSLCNRRRQNEEQEDESARESQNDTNL